MGNLQIASVNADDVQIMISHFRDEGKSYSTIKKAYDALLHIKEITGDGIYVFESKNKKPITPKNIDRLIRCAATRAGFPEDRILCAHALRHTFASMLFAKGVDVKTVSKILGHANVSITYNTYINIIEKQKVDAVKILDNIF